jgi:aminoglycoside 2'-N-acetyltransferase I
MRRPSEPVPEVASFPNGGVSEPHLRTVRTAELGESDVVAIRTLLWAAFAADDPDEQFTEEDWEHALGGVHFVLEVDGEVVAHAAVVERELEVGGVPLRAGYVEAVATAPGRQRQGLGGRLMEAVTAFVRERYELGALGTGLHDFYARSGWRPWLGPSFVRAPDGVRRTPDDDGYILVLTTPTTPDLDPRASISCDWRAGDVW